MLITPDNYGTNLLLSLVIRSDNIMAANPFFSGRIPQELHQKVEEFCEREGKGKTEFMIEAFYKYLDLPIPTTRNSSDVTKEMFLELQERVYQTEAQIQEFQNLLKRIPETKTIDNIDIIPDNNPKELNHSTNDSSKTKDKNESKNPETSKERLANLNASEASEITGISNTQMSRNKNKVLEEIHKKGYDMKAETIFPEPIEIPQKSKDIILKGEKYKLICTGLDSRKKPIWSLKPCDNKYYQPVISNITNNINHKK